LHPRSRPHWNDEAWVTDLMAQQVAAVRAAEHEKM